MVGTLGTTFFVHFLQQKMLRCSRTTRSKTQRPNLTLRRSTLQDQPSRSIAPHRAQRKKVHSHKPQGRIKTNDVPVKVENNEGSQTTVCRVCLQEGNIPIHGNHIFEDVSQDLITATGISIQKDDEYPKHLCVSCRSLLQDAVQLRKTAQHSDQILKMEIVEPIEVPIELNDRAVDDLSMDVGGDGESLHEANMNGNEDKYIRREKHMNMFCPDIDSDSEEDDKQLIKRCPKKSEHLSGTKPREEISKSEKGNGNKIKTCVRRRKAKSYCRKCSIDLETEIKYNEHIQSEEHKNFKVICPLCSKQYDPLYLKTHLERHAAEITHVCDICGKGFIHINPLKQHRKTHFLDFPFKCTVCPYRGRSKYKIKKHMESHTDKAHQCPECMKFYSTKSNLRKHLLIHKPERDFQCDACPRGFHKKVDLERHVKQDHMAIKEHVCDLCGKAFGSRGKLMQHARKVHKRPKMLHGKALYVLAESQNTTANTQ